MANLLLAIIYLAFIGLGLPDSMLGAAWPKMYLEFGVPVSYAGVISIIISAGTIVSSLMSDRMNRKLGSGKLTALSVAVTAVAMLGFSVSDSYWMCCLWAIPYGLGAGSVDAALNNYAAIHFESRHMSWLHCMWGVGASLGPNIMGWTLAGGQSWNMGYRYVFLVQVALTLILFLSLPLWKKTTEPEVDADGQIVESKPLSLIEVLRIPGIKALMLAFFCYCSLESTAILWGSSYLVLHHGMAAEAAAGFSAMFCTGLMIGRAVSGFVTMKLNDTQMIRLGCGIIIVGIIVMFLPFGTTTALCGLMLIGLGCAPVYPCVIHSIPNLFGVDKSQAIVGMQMASAYTGTMAMPALFGLIANHISAALLPVYLMILVVLLIVMYEKLIRK